MEHQEYQTGLLASTIANFSMHPPKEPFTASDFMPSRREKPAKQRENHRQREAQTRAFLMSRVTEIVEPNA